MAFLNFLNGRKTHKKKKHLGMQTSAHYYGNTVNNLYLFHLVGSNLV